MKCRMREFCNKQTSLDNLRGFPVAGDVLAEGAALSPDVLGEKSTS